VLNSTANCAISDVQSLLSSQSFVWFHGTRFNFISFHTRKESTAFSEAIFMKFTPDQQHYVEISFEEFYPNMTRNKILIPPKVICGFHSADFRDIHG
jgi:hypothetical protein